MKHQIFISYRRMGGDILAKTIHDHLSAIGYTVFLDVDKMGPGLYNRQLEDVINDCTDFILILSPNALDFRQNEIDWVKEELLLAISCKKNIIPVVMNGFSWPDSLPEEMVDLPFYEKLDADTKYWDAMFDRLCGKLLHSRPSAPKNTEKYPVTCHSKYTPAVLNLLSSIKKQEIYGAKTLAVTNALRYYFTEKINLSGHLLASDKKTFDAAIAKINLLNSATQAEIRSFFEEMDHLEYEFKKGRFQTPSRNIPFLYEGITYYIEDIAQVHEGGKCIIAYTYPAGQLPLIHLFTVNDEDDSVYKIPENTELHVNLLSSYAMAVKLFCPHIPYIENNKEIIKKIKLESAAGTDPQAYIPFELYQYYKAPSLFATFYKKAMLGIKSSCCSFSLENTYESAPNGKPTDFLGLNGLQAIDIVNIDSCGNDILSKPQSDRDKTTHLVFLLKKSTPKNDYCLCEPLTIYQIQCDKDNQQDKKSSSRMMPKKYITTVNAVSIDDLNQLYPDLARRMALKLSLMKQWNLIR